MVVRLGFLQFNEQGPKATVASPTRHLTPAAFTAIELDFFQRGDDLVQGVAESADHRTTVGVPRPRR